MAKTEPPKDLDGNVWKNSKAKKKLVEDLLTGHVPRETGRMGPRAVYDLEDRRELFHQFPYTNFRTNLNTLRKTHLQLFSMAAKDLEMLIRDRILYPKKTIDRRGKPVWDGSEAQLALRHDVRAGLHLGDFVEFYLSNGAYQLFDKSTFRKHIGQEKRRELYIAYMNLIE